MSKKFFKKLKIKEKFIPKKYFSSLDRFTNNSICFTINIDRSILKKINKVNSGIVILKKKNKDINKNILQFTHPNPRTYFFYLLNNNVKNISNFYKKPKIGVNAQLHKTVVLGSNCSIGHNTKIHANVVIGDNVKIGNNCIIKSNTVIGQKGLGNFYLKRKIMSINHIGMVKIGNNVEIGALNTIAQGTLDSTIIKSNNKLDDHVHVAHNCIINENNELTAGVTIGGSVKIGKNNFFGLNATIKNGITIGSNNFIGISSSIIKSISNNYLAYGNPAKLIKKS